MVLFSSGELFGDNPEITEGAKEAKKLVYVIPIEGTISSPQLYILRRGIKEAIEKGVNVIVLKMNTPGGSVAVTLDMMDAISKFEGETITFVNDEAISAGSYIAIVTDHIYFSKNGVMGAAAVIQSDGEDLEKTLNKKMDSYLRAKVRSLTKKNPYRADVQRAMMDKDFVFKIGGKTIKKKGELLSVTAEESMALYGNPPHPLLATGIVSSVDELLNQRYGQSKYEVKVFNITWSESFAKWLIAISPALIGLGFLLLFIEFKTPGFGLPGILGIASFVIVFLSDYVAGLSGMGGLVVFLIGIIFLGLEIFVFPGTVLAGAVGVIFLLSSLIWSMVDNWPQTSFSFSWDVLYLPITKVLGGIGIAITLAFLFAKFIPKSLFWDKLILSAKVSASTSPTHETETLTPSLPPIGETGTTLTDMFPTGEVEINGKRYEARAAIGILRAGTKIRVVGYQDFSLIVSE